MPIKGNWYITIAAVRQYMDITGLSGPLEDANPEFRRAVAELTAFSESARPVNGPPSRSGAVTYRDKLADKRRIEFSVVDSNRPEGELPQLVRVRLKDQIRR